MSILNRASDGLYSVLLSFVSALLREKGISRDELFRTFGPPPSPEHENRLVLIRGTLNRWIALGLFAEYENKVCLAIEPNRGESAESFLNRIPAICRELVFRSEHCDPFWPEVGAVKEEGTGVSADLCRGLAWCICQDIYTLPSSWNEASDLIRDQVISGRTIIQNDTRWAGLKDWARFLGFAVESSAGTFFDPTVAVRSEIEKFMKYDEQLPVDEFLSKLALRLPVLDTGAYKIEVEQVLKLEAWSSPPIGYLSTSLSFALRRLQKQNVIDLRTLSDAGSKLTLTRKDRQSWGSFTHVSLKEGVV